MVSEDEHDDEVLYQPHGRFAYLTLNRPERLNALSTRTFQHLSKTLTQLEADNEVRVGVIRGAGRALCAGMHLGSDSDTMKAEKHGVWGDRERLRYQVSVWRQIWDNPKIVITQAHGYVLAGGLQFVSLADLAVAAEDCVFSYPRLPLGGGYLGPVFASLYGVKRAKELELIPRRRLSAAEAKDWGLVNRVVPAKELEQATADLANEVAKIPPDLLALRKASVNRVVGAGGLDAALAAAPEWDTIAHFQAGPARGRELIAEVGLKRAIEQFENDGL
jgi:enoyl-CoA hydratase